MLWWTTGFRLSVHFFITYRLLNYRAGQSKRRLYTHQHVSILVAGHFRLFVVIFLSFSYIFTRCTESGCCTSVLISCDLSKILATKLWRNNFILKIECRNENILLSSPIIALSNSCVLIIHIIQTSPSQENCLYYYHLQIHDHS